MPPRVDYRLTELGLTLSETVCSLMSWAVVHADDIDEARAAYDHKNDHHKAVDRAGTDAVTAPAHPR